MNSYSERFICYLDLLGFSELVKKSENNELIFSKIKKITQILSIRNCGTVNSTIAKLKNKSAEEVFRIKDSLRFLGASDGIFISVIDNDKTWVQEFLSNISQLCIISIANGILVRGAIDYGFVYHDDLNCFGPAVVKAVDSEKNAHAPRIILSEKAMEQFEKVSDFNKDNYFLKDTDGHWFLNFLELLSDSQERRLFLGWIEDQRETIAQVPTMENCLNRIKEIINKNSTKIHPDKLAWLNKYIIGASHED